MARFSSTRWLNTDDEIVGTGGSDFIATGGGDDTIHPGAGRDFVDGGRGTDTAVYSGNFGDYDISFGWWGWFSVIDGSGERDWLRRVEVLEFDDATVTIENGSYSVVYKEPNEPPTAITLDTADPELAENTAGLTVGVLTVTDVDDTVHTFTTSDNRFEVVGATLKLKDGVSLNHETEPTINVGVTATDSRGQSITETFIVTVADLNDAPVASTVDLGSIEEDGPPRIITESELLAGASDEDGDTLSITALSIQDGVGALLDNTDGTWTYTPEADDDTDVTFAYTVSDGVAETVGTATLDITPVHTSGDSNDRVFTGRDDDVIYTDGGHDWVWSGKGDDTVNAGSGYDKVFASWGDDTIIHVASENEGSWDYYDGGRGHDTLRLIVTQEIYDTEAFQNELAKYEAKIDKYGSTSGTFKTLGVTFKSFETIEVEIENEAPVIDQIIADQETDEDTTWSFTVPVDAFSDVNGDPLTLTATLVDGSDLPARLSFDGSTFAGTPPEDFNGDIGLKAIANDGEFTAEQTFVLTVNPVNDAPSFTIGEGQEVLEGAGAQTVAGFITDISAGPLDESGQQVSFAVTTDNDALFSVLPAISSTGDLTYTLAADTNGTATVTVTAMDDGGTENGGLDTSAAQTFQINVTPVNDAPSFTIGEGQEVLEDAGAQTVAGFITDISAGPSDESGQTVSFFVTTDNDALFSVLPAISATGELTYTLAADANGSATVTVTAMDDGGTANGGVDTSGEQTFQINVTPVNDVPSFTLGDDQTVDEDSGAHTVAGYVTDISPGPLDESSQQVSFAVTTDNDALFSVLPAISATGELTYTLADDANGTATVTVTAIDDGGTGNGGVDTSGGQTFQINVTPEAPTGVINLSDLDGSNGFVIDGTDVGNIGHSLSYAGDVNDDGYDDVILGALEFVVGQSFVIYGGASIGSTGVIAANSLDGTDGSQLTSYGTNDGFAVSGGGDLNGDGIDDVAMAGAYALDLTSGTVSAFFGLEDGYGASLDIVDAQDTSAGQLFVPPSDAELKYTFGVDVSSGGDFNGDGIDDLVVGMDEYLPPNASFETGGVFVFYGSNSLGGSASIESDDLDGTNGFVISGVVGIGSVGHSVSSNGDVDIDGYDDIVIGAPREGTGGTVYVYYGGPDIGTSGSVKVGGLAINYAELTGATGDDVGWSVAIAGDINGDGTSDILIGAPGADNGLGKTYVVYGGIGGVPSMNLANLDKTDGFTITDSNGGGSMGYSVSGAGDVNGDGIGDIIIGAFTDTSNIVDSSGAYVVFGVDGTRDDIDLSALDGTNGFALGAVNANDGLGFSVSNAGDLNGDGFDDIIVSAPDTLFSATESDAYVVFGQDFSGIVDQLGTDGNDTLTGTEDNEIMIGALGDDTINGEGGNDVLKGAAGDDILAGGDGFDTLIGGSGNDTFVFEYFESALVHEDTIVDFVPGEDLVELQGFTVTFDELDTNDDGVLTTADDDVYGGGFYNGSLAIVLEGNALFGSKLIFQDIHSLSESDFIFA